MAGEKVKLYGMWGSPFSKRVEIALKLKGVKYEFIDEDLKNKSPDLLKYNPIHKKVPVLLHGDKVIVESQVIIEYIDETWDSGTRILPKDPYERALARFWAKFLDDKLIPSTFKTLWLGQEQVLEEALENLKILDNELKGKKFLGGESIGFVDIVAGFVGFWLGIIEEGADKVIVTKEAFPWVCKWQDEFVKCGVVKENLPPRDKLAPFIKASIDARKANASK